MATLKTIGEYKKDYEAAKAAGDAAGMQAANDGANAVRASMGQAAQSASADISKTAAAGTGASTGTAQNTSGGSSAAGSAYSGLGSLLSNAVNKIGNAVSKAVGGGTGTSTGTSSGTGQTYNSVPAGMGNSAAGVGVNNSVQAEYQREMNENSNKWWTATPEERSALEARNKELASLLGGTVAFDPKTGTWSGTAAEEKVTVPMTTGQVNDYSNYLNDMYAAKKRAALSQLDNAYQQNVNAINRAGEGVGATYQNARNQAAGASELSARNFAEYAAAAGLNSGTGGQAELARNVALQNNINDINTQESGTLADLELQRANAETQYNNAIAQAEATGDYELAAALYQEKVRVDEALIQQQLNLFQMDLQKYQLGYQSDRDAVADSQWERQFGYTTSQADRENLASYGQTFLQNGLMPSQSMLDAMGITAEDAQRFIQNVQLQASLKAAGSGSGSGGSGSSSSRGTMTLTTAKQAAKSGVFSDDVLSVLRANGYSDEMLSAIYGYTPYNSNFKEATGNYRYDNTGNLFTTDEYNRFVYTVMGNRTKEGMRQTIEDAYNEGKITETQADSLLTRFGIDH